MTAKILSHSASEPSMRPPAHTRPKTTQPKLRTTMGVSFTGAPEGFNQAPRFPRMERDSNSSNGLFLGSPFSMTEAGPGSYPGIDKSTCLTKGPSKTRIKTFNRRPRDCRPLGGSAATLSLHGADRLFLEESPGPGKIPASSFALAQEKKGFCSSVFASEQARFVPVRETGQGLLRTFGMHEKRKYKRVLPPKNSLLGEDGLKVEDERTKTRNRRIALLAEQKTMATLRKTAKMEKKLKIQQELERLEEMKNQLTPADFPPDTIYKVKQKSGRSSPAQTGRASPPNAALMATATIITPFEGTIDFDQCNEVKQIQSDMPPAAQFKDFSGWKVGLQPLNFDYGSFVRPWTTSHGGGGHLHHQKPHTSGSSHSVRFDGSVTGSVTSNERMGFSRGNDDGSMTADSANTDTVRFKEKRKMKYPWMKDMYKEVITKEAKQDIGDVESLDSFKAPNTTSMRFY